MDIRSNVRSINEKYDLVLSEREHEHEREQLSNVQAELMQSTHFLKFIMH